MKVYKFTIEPYVLRCKFRNNGVEMEHVLVYDAIKKIELNEKNEIVVDLGDECLYLCKQKNPDDVILQLNRKRQSVRRPTIY